MQTKCHLSVLVHEQAKIYGEKTVMNYRDFGSLKWKKMTWTVFSKRVKQVSNAMLNMGIRVQENIGVFSQNTVQFVCTDFGAYGIRAVTVPFYATSSEQQIQYIVQDAQIRFLFVGEQEQYDKARRILPLCSTLEKIIVFDPSVRIAIGDPNSIFFDDFLKLGENLPRQSELERLWGQANETDLTNIIYTSGTTGDSKGVMLCYSHYHAAMDANGRCVPVTGKDRVMTFLPMTHIFERAWIYLCLTVGAELIINTYPKEIQETLRETHPSCMCAVPRFWEKVYIGVQEKIEKSNAFERKLFKRALSVGRKHNIEYLSRGKRPPLHVKLEYELMNRTVFSLLRKQLGLENAHFFPTAGSYVSAEVEEFTHSVGINMIVGYGLTESVATVSCDHADKTFTVGSVGRPIHSIDVKIGENGEILLKGPTITNGYYNREALNATAFDADGFFHTGDAGYIKNGELFLTERIKELYKTSNGKYIAPQMIESKLLVDRFIDQVAVIADQRKFVSALIVPAFPVLEEYAKDNGIEFESRQDLCKNKRIVKMLQERISTLQQQLASYEKIKKFTLLPTPFTMERGELTNTLKIKRTVLGKHYADEIEAMYAE